LLHRLWFSPHWRAGLWQALLLAAALGGVAWLIDNATDNLTRRGIAGGFDFLSQTARFPISEGLLSYESTDTFGRAILVGLVNTLVVSAVVVLLSTAAGFALAVLRRSGHPLLSGFGAVYVELMRNTPLVVQLLFWYGLVTTSLPPVSEAWSPLPGFYLSLRGVALPGLVLGGGLPGLDLPLPYGPGFRGGVVLTPELSALLIGLVVYSTAFSGEIIRGGIAAVPTGQWEAGRALGLRPWPLLRMVVLPQALRTIVPPMTSQYLTITKNTTLALAVGYPDLGFVIATTINQTGQAVEGVLMLMGVFLGLSLGVSMFMNWYNQRLLRWHG
jgi:general L-amino acid transport system permease protein